jgi:phenylalanyl-tRNA synthetase alpha chain
MKDKLNSLKDTAIKAINATSSIAKLEEIRINILGKKGELTDILKGIGSLPASERPQIGQIVNITKSAISEKLEEKKVELQKKELETKLTANTIDTTLPGTANCYGKKHPLTQTVEDIIAIFNRIGFSVKEGPDIESEHYNFESLNIPADHPARDMHDTFYLNNDDLLRTHTSPVQIRVMEKLAPPLKIIVPGKVYRCDSDVTHSPIFNQVEGLYVNENVTFADLKGTLEFFLTELFGKNKKVRFRPSYFPFTEPSTEVDVQCVQCNGKGCSFCKQTGWLEILGAGMVNRKVFRAVGYDPDQVTGFAFGLGADRIAMLKYEINDIRLLYENDIRFLKQF